MSKNDVFNMKLSHSLSYEHNITYPLMSTISSWSIMLIVTLDVSTEIVRSESCIRRYYVA